VAAQQKLLERNVETVLTVLSQVPVVTGRDTAQAEALFRKALVSHPAIANLLQMDEQGRIVASAQPRSSAISVEDRRFFRAIRETRAFGAGEYVVGRVVQVPSFHFALPLDSPGEFVGGLVAQVSLTKLDDLVHQVSLPEHSRLLLVDHAGLRLHHAPPREASPLGQPVIPSLIRAIDSSPEDCEVLVDHDQLGLKVIYGLVRLRLVPSDPPYMVVVAGIPHPTLAGSINAENLGPLGILLASIFLAFLSARFISTRFIGAGLEQLAATTRRLAAGDLAVRSGVRGGCAEVQALARSFDAMAESLAEAQQRRDQAEEALRLKERRLTDALAWKESILDNTAMGVLALTRNRAITEVNNKLLEMFGYAQAELVGEPVSVLHASPEDSEAFGERYWAGTATGEVVSVEWPMRRKDGGVFWASLAGRAVNPGDLEQGVVWVVLDIDERRRAEAEILEMKDRAEAASRAKSEFLANMSHEVRTPLNGILGMLQLMQTTCLDAEQEHYASMAIQSGCRLNGLLTDILDLSKVEAGKMILVSLPFQLEDLFRSVFDLFQPVALQNGVHLGFTLDPGLPATLLGDFTRVQQVLSNLVGNALKFTSAGFVRVGAKPLDPARDGRQRVLFWVEDSGAGIADETLAILFEPFSQGDGRLTRRHQGAGLGLAICKRLVGLMEGNIAVDTELGAGSTFCFTAIFGRTQAPGS
jgi:PAS domain S-box-containing protein